MAVLKPECSSINGFREMMGVLSPACVCVSSGPRLGAGDSPAEGARASWRTEEETLRAGWGRGGLGRGGGGYGQRTATTCSF